MERGVDTDTNMLLLVTFFFLSIATFVEHCSVPYSVIPQKQALGMSTFPGNLFLAFQRWRKEWWRYFNK